MPKTKEAIRPLVSVLMPVYNCEDYVEEAVTSIIKQTYANLEIVIVDDGSTDSTYEILARLASDDKRIRLFKNKKNMRIVKTLNLGVSKCNGKYIARMDSDDYRFPDSIAKQVAFLEKNPDIILVGGAVDIVDINLNLINHRSFPLSDEQIKSRLFRYNPIAHPTIMVRGEVLRANPYQLDWSEDYELYFRLGKLGQLANLSDTLLKLRIHQASVSRSKARHQEYLMLYIRLKAVFEHGYKMSLADKLYFVGQLVSMYIIPTKLKYWLYNKFRGLSS